MSDVDALRARLVAARENARTADEVCAAVARIEYYNRQWHDGKRSVADLTCPENRIPAPADLAAWLPECPEPGRAKAAARMDRVAHVLMAADPPRTPLEWTEPSPAERAGGSVTIGPTRDLHTGEVIHPAVTRDTARPVIAPWSRHRGPFDGGPVPVATDAAVVATFARRWLLTDPAEAGWLTRDPGDTLTPGAERLHALWLLALQHDPGLLHPLAPLVRAWLQHPVPVEADDRRHQNLPDPLTRTQYVVRHDDNGQVHLPFDLDGHPPPPRNAARFEVGWLPHLAPPETGLSLMMLNMLDFGASRGRGGPVPVPPRTGWELILWPEPGDWRAEKAEALPTHAQLAARVWPRTSYKASKHGPQLYRAAKWLNNPDNAMWWRRNGTSRPILLVTFFAPPFYPYNPDDVIGAHVILPDGGRKRGAQFDAPLRRELAATSYRQHRVYIAAVCLWDAHATVKGHLVQLTLPVVRRDAAGYVLDAHGRIVTEKRRPTRRATHPRAVQTGQREHNPAADDAYPWLEGDDVILAAHHRVAATQGARTHQRRETVTTLDKLRTRPAGAVLDFEARYRGEGVLTGPELAALARRPPPAAELEAIRLLPSRSHFAAHQKRREAREKRRKGRRA